MANYNDVLSEVNKILGQFGGNSFTGGSFIDQHRGATSALNFLDSISPEEYEMTQQQYDSLGASLKGRAGQAAAGGAVAGLTGLIGIGTNIANSAKIADTTYLNDKIEDMSYLGNTNYSNINQLANAYDSIGNAWSPVTAKGIRGMNGWQKAGSIGSSALTGLTTGLSIGGPWGALVGGVLGTIGGVAGVLTGDQTAKIESKYLNAVGDMAQENAYANAEASGERLIDQNNRIKSVNSGAYGGKIVKERVSMKDYADRILRRNRAGGYMNPAFHREYCKGGVRVRFKVK